MHQLISKEEPRVAFLSFSTMGSAQHYKVKRMQDATKIFSQKYPNSVHEGELQFDAAVDNIVARKKIDKPILDGNANVFIFPDCAFLAPKNHALAITLSRIDINNYSNSYRMVCALCCFVALRADFDKKSGLR